MDELIQIMSKGWTPGAVGIWGGIAIVVASTAGRALLRWIIGMPERRRVANETIGAEESAAAALYTRMNTEMERLGKRIASLEERVAELEEEKRGVVKERDAALAEVARLRAVNLGRGQVTNEMQVLESAKRIAGGA